MRFSVTFIKPLLGSLLMGLAIHAQAAPAAEPVKVNLQVFKVTLANGKEFDSSYGRGPSPSPWAQAG